MRLAKKRSNKAATPGVRPSANAETRDIRMGDIRHPAASRKNIPPAKIAAEGVVPAIPKAEYAYNPHLPPVLRFHHSGGHGSTDALPKLLELIAMRGDESWRDWAKTQQFALTEGP
ncbi:MAG: hypothetical protein KF757_08965 [Phycisphaeraceae bacterium]|nr:hypothetical protein [Phycisphaeraceae bacterium]MCW5762884.1 hypothetical protein [Phycisphaeraceae bacterium]